mgnify:CR=1 FL=1
MQMSVILFGDKLKRFCEELNVDSSANKILLKIEEDKAKYYSLSDDGFCDVDVEIAKKYI